MPSLHKKAYLAIAVVIAVVALALCLLIATYGEIKTARARLRETRDSNKIQVLVAVAPMADLVRRVGGERVQVAALVPEGKSPETFAPAPAQLAAVAASRLFFLVGTPVEERFLENVRSAARDVRIADLREIAPPEEAAEPKEEGEESETADKSDRHCGGAEDPHLWTSPALARAASAKIAAELSRLDPDGADVYAQNAKTLDEELAALQSETAAALAPYSGRFFVVFHPAYGWFAREFGLVQRAIEVDGKAPRPKELEILVRDAREAKIRAIIAQPEFNRAAVEVVADAVGAKIVVHSPLQSDYFENIRSLVAAILEEFASDDARK